MDVYMFYCKFIWKSMQILFKKKKKHVSFLLALKQKKYT